MGTGNPDFDPTKSDPLGQDPTRSSPVGEGELMAYVEGELTPAREAQVRAWIAQRPRMQARLEEMRRERSLLASIADEHAPAGLLENALQIAERSMLLDEPTAEFSSLPQAPYSFAAAKQERSYWPQLAAAAALVITAAGLYAIWPRTPASISGPLAMESARKPHVSDATAVRDEKSITDNRLAKTDAAKIAEVAEPTVAQPAIAAASSEIVGPRMPRPTTEISRQRALLLAGEGRLLVKVGSLEPARAIAAVDKLLRTPAGRELGIAHAAPTVVVALVERPSTRPLFRDRSPASDTVVMASDRDDAGNDFPARIVPAKSAELELPSVYAVYVAEIAADENAIGALVDALSGSPDGAVVLEELPEPAWKAPKIDEETVLWWEQPPSKWNKRVSVPVVVEGM